MQLFMKFTQKYKQDCYKNVKNHPLRDDSEKKVLYN